MKTKIVDVANYAGVSIATVSHVVNGTRHVSEETTKKVRNAIDALGYYPDVSARNFKTGKKHIIGFIVPDISNNYFSSIIEKVESTIAEKNYQLIVVNTKETKQREFESIEVLTAGIVDGLIIASTAEKVEELSAKIPSGFPVVLVDRTFPECPYSTCTISSYYAVYESVQSLIYQGHKKIGYIAGLAHLSTTKERLAAYKQALSDYGYLIDDDIIFFADSMSNSAYPLAGQLLDLDCTALVISNNIMSFDVLTYLNSNGIQAGKDVAIVGFNDSNSRAFLSSVIPVISEPTEELGLIAGKQILSTMKNPFAKGKDIILYSSFINF